MVAPAHMDVEDAADRLLAALPEGDAAGRARALPNWDSPPRAMRIGALRRSSRSPS